MRAALVFCWYNFAVGLHWDRRRHHLYISPVPMVAIRVKFRRRVLCHKPECNRPAVMVCVHESDNYGIEFNRDALCDQHGQLGPCPDTATWPQTLTRSKHIPIEHPWYFEETERA